MHLAKTLDGRCEPREAVRRVLGIVDAARFLDLDADARLRRLQHLVGGSDSLLAPFDQTGGSRCQNAGPGLEARNGHSRLPLSEAVSPVCPAGPADGRVWGRRIVFQDPFATRALRDRWALKGRALAEPEAFPSKFIR